MSLGSNASETSKSTSAAVEEKSSGTTSTPDGPARAENRVEPCLCVFVSDFMGAMASSGSSGRRLVTAISQHGKPGENLASRQVF